jgi:hypothetical protein
MPANDDFGARFGLLLLHELTCCPLEFGLASSMTTDELVRLKMMAARFGGHVISRPKGGVSSS